MVTKYLIFTVPAEKEPLKKVFSLERHAVVIVKMTHVEVGCRCWLDIIISILCVSSTAIQTYYIFVINVITASENEKENTIF